jgi:hypothetical protein
MNDSQPQPLPEKEPLEDSWITRVESEPLDDSWIAAIEMDSASESDILKWLKSLESKHGIGNEWGRLPFGLGLGLPGGLRRGLSRLSRRGLSSRRRVWLRRVFGLL